MKFNLSAEAIAVPVASVLTAMVVGMILIGAIGYDPFFAYQSLFTGMVGSPTAIAGMLFKATPLILTGLSVAIAFRAGLFNIGGTGQLIWGMLAATWVALHVDAPNLIQVLLMLTAGGIAGAAWGALAGFLKAVRGAHEVITTIMLNYVAIKIGEYMLRPGGMLQEHGNSNPQSEKFAASDRLPSIWDPTPFVTVHLGIIVAIAMAVLMWFVVQKTSLGYQIRAVGLNPEAARYGGMSVAKITIISMAMAGMFAGLAGVCIVSGDLGQLTKSQFSAEQAGFVGIAVALLGRNTAAGVVAAALLFGGLQAGALEVQNVAALPGDLATKLIDVILGLIIFFVGADAVFRRLYARFSTSRASKAGVAA